MKTKAFSIIAFLAILAHLLGGPAAAQEPQPPAPPYPLQDLGKPFDPLRTPEGYWFMPESSRLLMEAADVLPQATGGPDDFGYTWDDSVEFHWIDASSGTDTGLSGDSRGKAVGPIPLPFSFKYYENTYNEVWIAASGYLAFSQTDYWSAYGSVPSPATPNNVIAPYWTEVYIGPGSWIRYRSDGIAPNRYFVIEWHDVTIGEETYRFEVILYENGDIVFQYHTMGYGCGEAGIEDSTGWDGLTYISSCAQVSSNKAVRFSRPAPSARVSIRPPYHIYQSRFTHAGAAESFQVSIRNIGDLGADTYDLFTSSSWPVSFYAADGTTPLADTDGDGTVDTGSVAQGSTVTITVKVQTPAVVNVGDYNSATITVRSSLNTGKNKTITLRTAVPAPFAQVYQDDADGAMSLYLVKPSGQVAKKVTPDKYYADGMAVAEAPNGNFVYVWSKWRCLNRERSVYGKEIEYVLLDRHGNVVQTVSKLTDHSGATMDTYDRDPAVAVAPNGRIGVLWNRELRNSSSSQFNFNIWFAILDTSGNVVYGPVNLTNNNAWGTWDDLNVPYFRSPRIAATSDNRFVLAWHRSTRESAGLLEDIYYAVLDTYGAEVKSVTKLTAGRFYYGPPALAALSGNRALLTYEASGGISYVVLDSDGNVVKPETSTGRSGSGLDVVQLSNGNILIAWSYFTDIKFIILDSTTYNLTAGPTTLDNPIATYNDYVSVAADAAGHAILTWVGYDQSYRSYRANLYYALVDGRGNILTPPMIFRTASPSPWGFYSIQTSSEGYGNTSYSYPFSLYLPLIMRNCR